MPNLDQVDRERNPAPSRTKRAVAAVALGWLGLTYLYQEDWFTDWISENRDAFAWIVLWLVFVSVARILRREAKKNDQQAAEAGGWLSWLLIAVVGAVVLWLIQEWSS